MARVWGQGPGRGRGFRDARPAGRSANRRRSSIGGQRRTNRRANRCRTPSGASDRPSGRPQFQSRQLVPDTGWRVWTPKGGRFWRLVAAGAARRTRRKPRFRRGFGDVRPAGRRTDAPIGAGHHLARLTARPAVPDASRAIRCRTPDGGTGRRLGGFADDGGLRRYARPGGRDRRGRGRRRRRGGCGPEGRGTGPRAESPGWPPRPTTTVPARSRRRRAPSSSSRRTGPSGSCSG